MADPEAGQGSDLAKANRILQRRLGRLEANYRQLEALQDSNATVMSRLVGELEEERAKSQRLLRNVLPERIVGRLERGEAPIADRHEDVTVLFGDFVDFTRISAALSPSVLVEELNELFRGFDEICLSTGIEKIKTVGDAYLAVGGLNPDRGDGVHAIAETALRMTALVAEHARRHATWQIRVGLSVGPIVAGVVGASKFAYDVWGDTVNIASRLESTSEPGRIHVSAELAKRLEPRYELEPRGLVDLKGKGAVETYFLRGR
ncbi:MAG TPA: adenylate/guanylate cyclase domain-containing protein, partial [Actinomycetota bacterium]